MVTNKLIYISLKTEIIVYLMDLLNENLYTFMN